MEEFKVDYDGICSQLQDIKIELAQDGSYITWDYIHVKLFECKQAIDKIRKFTLEVSNEHSFCEKEIRKIKTIRKLKEKELVSLPEIKAISTQKGKIEKVNEMLQDLDTKLMVFENRYSDLSHLDTMLKHWHRDLRGDNTNIRAQADMLKASNTMGALEEQQDVSQRIKQKMRIENANITEVDF